VTHAGQDKITVIDGLTDTVKATFSIGSEARGIDFDQTAKLLYVVVQAIPVGSRPHCVVFDPDNGRIFVTNRGGCNSTPGTVSVIDSNRRTVVATVQVVRA